MSTIRLALRSHAEAEARRQYHEEQLEGATEQAQAAAAQIDRALALLNPGEVVMESYGSEGFVKVGEGNVYPVKVIFYHELQKRIDDAHDREVESCAGEEDLSSPVDLATPRPEAAPAPLAEALA